MTTHRRVTVTIPADVLKEADRLARSLDRSRSWVVSEALRRYTLAPPGSPGGTPSLRPPAVRQEPAPPYVVQQAFRDAELSRLRSDLALTPEDRVRLAEEVARVAPDDRRRPRFRRVLQFDSYEDYLDWKRFAEVQP
jgi:hypothetical protein